MTYGNAYGKHRHGAPLYGPIATARTNPRTALAALLMQEGSSTAPVQHWMQGVARMGQAAIGGLMLNREEEREREQQQRYTRTMADALMAYQGRPAETQTYGDGTTINWNEQKPNPRYAELLLSQNPDTLPLAWDMHSKNMEMARILAAEERKPPQVETFFDDQGREQKRQWNRKTASWEIIGGAKAPGQQNTRRLMTTEEKRAAGLPVDLVAQIDTNGGIHTVHTPDNKQQPGGPYAGTGLDAQNNNLLLRGLKDPGFINTAEYAVAYRDRSQPQVRFDQASGSMVTVQPDMSMFPKPTFVLGNAGSPPPSAPAAGPQAAPQVGPLTAKLSEGTNISPVAAPQGPLSQQLAAPPQAMGPQSAPEGMAQGTTRLPEVIPQQSRPGSTLPVVGSAPGAPTTQHIGGATVTTQSGTPRQTQEQMRTALTEAATIINSLGDLRNAYSKAGVIDRGKSMFGMTTSLNTAYNKAALMAKGEALFNLGVLNGPDLEVIRRVLPDPSTLKGSATDQKAVEDAISQVETLVQDRITARMSQLGMEPMDIRQYGRQIRAAGPGNPSPQSEGDIPQLRGDAAGKAAYDRLPPGAEYIAPDGSRRRKQG